MEIVSIRLQHATGEEQTIAVTPCTEKCPSLDEATWAYRQEEVPHFGSDAESLIGCLHRDGTVCGAELRRRTR